ncbi:alpha/beta hydrolase [Pontibacillus chungwhensis BH030062]|uniref:Alpha/beta hydrolase n=1 Tax=Pontibacillus chungwhensis BH030062 TaxID=1385513 RepID=A0A0A2UWF7_9BACI|nr:hypothetical protein [Pontibacillus chungwhensis]KGP92642.1 alpha/beta hydrolase [Pontibacillus chungwhensis BH030062]
MKKVTHLLILLTLFVLMIPSITLAGSIKEGGEAGTPGEWWAGESSSSISPSNHPILFVHGLNSSSTTWTINNDMDETAYGAGYETAFIDLYPTKDMWENGAMLAQKIKEISNYFGEKVVVVAHSKGGIDTQAALVHYGADPYVEKVITLSSPHYGSQLADLAYSSWAGWLSGILGSKNDATYSLQTGYMDYYRSVTDKQSNVLDTPIYTLGGTKWGSFGSSLYWGGLYLSPYGSNDGAVTVNSSRLPYATEIKVGDWNHTTIKEGSSTFFLFEDYLSENVNSFTNLQVKDTRINHEDTESDDRYANSYTHGGSYKGNTQETIVVEPGVDAITIDWISEQSETTLQLASPDGKSYTAFHVNEDETEYLNGAYHHSTTIKSPEAGKWTLSASNKHTEHFLLNVTYNSSLNSNLTANIRNGMVHINSKDRKLKVKTDMTVSYYKKGKLKQVKVNPRASKNSYRLPNLGEGIYNMTLNIKGTLDQHPVERTMIQSVYVDENGQLFGH